MVLSADAWRNNNMVYVLLGNGFEEIEALTAVDVLRRCGVEVRMAGPLLLFYDAPGAKKAGFCREIDKI